MQKYQETKAPSQELFYKNGGRSHDNLGQKKSEDKMNKQ